MIGKRIIRATWPVGDPLRDAFERHWRMVGPRHRYWSTTEFVKAVYRIGRVKAEGT